MPAGGSRQPPRLDRTRPLRGTERDAVHLTRPPQLTRSPRSHAGGEAISVGSPAFAWHYANPQCRHGRLGDIGLCEGRIPSSGAATGPPRACGPAADIDAPSRLGGRLLELPVRYGVASLLLRQD